MVPIPSLSLCEGRRSEAITRQLFLNSKIESEMEQSVYEIYLAILMALVVLVAYLFYFGRQGLVLLGAAFFLFVVVARLINIFSYL